MTSSSTQPQEKQKVQTATPWSVIVYDDPVNLMAYVTMVLIKIFGYNKSKAETLMLEIHNAGKSIVWAGEKEKAELYVQQLHSFQLQASLEKAD
ncbi:ATP-dependent Clp protease adapter protein ClpS [Rubritalea halochordaticola]|uniref:ATP-dependent Clp protease adapter protein ClpS n=1 Tax=Rubritalea halochordaticola TaxID=714537 RepID=A0ABP9UWM1_9BACT